MKQCKICKGIFGTHIGQLHLLKILEDVEKVRQQYPEDWSMFFNKKLLRQEVEKWMKVY